jgi:hypothetical protein
MVKLYSLALGYAIYMNNTNTIFNKLHLMVFKDLIFLRNLRNKTENNMTLNSNSQCCHVVFFHQNLPYNITI